MSVGQVHLFSMVAQLAIALALYAHRLPRRSWFSLRCAAALAGVAAITALAVQRGFSLYPTLTDDASFARAALQFLSILAFTSGLTMALWNCSAWTALFCSSSAYLLQNLAYGLDRVAHLTRIVPTGGAFATGSPAIDALSLWCSAALTFALFYALLASRLRRAGLLGIRNATMLFAIVVAMLVSILFDLALKDLPTFDIPWRYPVLLPVVQLVMSAFILVAEFQIIYNQALSRNVAVMETAMAEQSRHFELSSQTISAINRRVHDMRHQVFGILANGDGEALSHEQLAQIAREMQVYDASVRTGNAALDTVLTEKSLICAQEGITLTCVADGSALDAMAAADIYTLFGTAVDGALAAVRAAGEDERRALSLNVRDRMGMASIAIEHYLVGPEGGGERDENGRRLEVMGAIVERYGGTMATSHDGDVFHIDVLIPRP